MAIKAIAKGYRQEFMLIMVEDIADPVITFLNSSLTGYRI